MHDAAETVDCTGRVRQSRPEKMKAHGAKNSNTAGNSSSNGFPTFIFGDRGKRCDGLMGCD